MTTPPFVGRTGELEELTGRLAALRAGTGGVVSVVGEPGIGKTRLVEQAVAAHPGRLAWGTCVAGDGVPSFWPWRRVLRECATAETIAAAGSSWPDARLLAEGTSDSPLPDGASRYRIFDAVTAVLAAAAREGSLVVVLDDLHWADEGSVRLLQFAAAESRRLPVLLVCIYRDTELDEAHPLAAALHDLARSGPELVLGGLSAAELGVLSRSFRGEEAPADEQRLGATLHRQTGGNPFLAGEVLRLLPAGAEATAAELSGLVRAGGGVRAVVGRRLARLPQPTYNVLSWAAIDGTALDVDVLASAMGRQRTDVLAALDAALAARVVTLGAGGRLSFAHDLLRETLVASIALSERAHRHWALGVARASTAGGDVELVTRTAGHLVAGAAAGDVEEAGRWAVRAAEAARAVLAYEDAAAWYERALQTRRVAAAADQTHSALLLAVGAARLDAGQLPAAREAFLAAAHLARERGDAAQLASAALGLGAGLGGFEVALFDQAQIDLLEEALAALAEHDAPVRAWVLARLSVALSFVEGSDRRRRLSEDALAMGRRLGDDEVCAYALAAWCDAVSGPDDVDRRLTAAGEVVRLAAGAGLRPLELLGRRLRVVALLERGDVAGAAVEVEAFERIAEVLRQPLYRWYVPLWRATLAMAAGDLDRAVGLTDEAERLGAAASSPNARTLVTVQRFVELRCAGRFEEAAALAAELLAKTPDIAAPESLEGSWVVGDVVTGRSDRARRRADAIAARGVRAVRSDSEWLPDVAQLAEAAVALRHEKLAGVVFEALQPYAELFVVEGIGAAVCAPVAHYLAQTARVLGRLDEADRYAHLADQLCSAAGVVLFPPPLTPGPAVPAGPHGDEPAELRREGDVWAISYAGTTVRVRDSKGLNDLAVLLGSPGRAVHVTELTGAPFSSTAEDLDATAIASYRRRLTQLEEEIADAEADHDVDRRSTLAAERDFLVSELAGALGLGGRRRRAGDPVERSRKAVTGRIRDSIERINRTHPALGRHLTNSVRTGTWCCYQPERRVTWRCR